MSRKSRTAKSAAAETTTTEPTTTTTTTEATTMSATTEPTTTEPTTTEQDTPATEGGSPEEAPKLTEEQVRERCAAELAKAQAEHPERWAKVVSVVEVGSRYQPVRVVVRCAEPMHKQGPDGSPVSVCEGTREIATQDLFQVRQCAACAERKVRIARRAKAKARDKAGRALLAATKVATA